MKLWRHTLITAFAFLGITSAVLYSSCEKDSCADLKCKNGGSCAEGFCRCPTGYEGTECGDMAATKFIGMYLGNLTCAGSGPLVDTVDIWLKKAPNEVYFVEHRVITDTLSGTTAGGTLTFSASGSMKYTRAEVDAGKITVFTQESPTPTCSFIGFK